jgi:hypothetical protein
VTVKEMPTIAEIGCVAMMLELDEKGEVKREIGGEASGLIIHLAPSRNKFFVASSGQFSSRAILVPYGRQRL